jgi:transposase InsO family protein
VVHFRTAEEHVDRLREVFERLRTANLRLKPQKCTFLSESVSYLGHVISSDGIKANPDKISTIKNYPTPTNATAIKMYLGVCGFYRRLVPRFAHIAKPLTMLTKKDQPFVWNEEQEHAFNELKTALCSDPILRYPNFNKDFILTCDSSGYAISAILSQEVDGHDLPVAYYSRQLNKAEQNYSTYERELTAIISGIKHFRIYIYGRHFKIYTDHRPIQFLIAKENKSSRQLNWIALLAEYDYTIQYKPGTSIPHADGLSRIRVDAVQPICEPIYDRQRIKDEQRADVSLTQLITKLEADNTSDEDFALDDEGVLYRLRSANERDDKLVIPASMKLRILNNYHNLPYAGHQGAERTTKLLRSKFFWKSLAADVKLYCAQCTSCAERKTSPHLRKVPIERYKEVLRPFARTHMDCLGPFPVSASGNKHLLTFIDAYSRYVIAVPIKDQSARTVAQAFFVNVIEKHGVPEQLITDRGQNFASKLLNEVCAILHLKHNYTTAYSPHVNGAIERVHRVMSDLLSHYVNKSHTDWDEYVPFMLIALRSAINTSTNESGFFLLYGYDMPIPYDTITRPVNPLDNTKHTQESYAEFIRTRLADAYVKVNETIKKHVEYREKQYNKKTKPCELKLYDKVYLFDPVIKVGTAKKLKKKYRGPMRIISREGPVTFTVRDIETGKQQTVHANRLKPFESATEEDLEDSETDEDLPLPTTDSPNVSPLTSQFYDLRDNILFSPATDHHTPPALDEGPEPTKCNSPTVEPNATIGENNVIIPVPSTSSTQPLDNRPSDGASNPSETTERSLTASTRYQLRPSKRVFYKV